MPLQNAPPASIVATRQLTGVDASGREFSMQIAIGLPYEAGPGEWACPIGLDGLHSKLRDMRGHDSFQALMLAQRLAHQLLTAHVDKGGKLLDGPAGSPVSVDALFNSGTLT